MKNELFNLIETSYNVTEAENFFSFYPNEYEIQQLAQAGNAVLELFPYTPGACALMTAMWAAFIRDNTNYPIHAVCGSLFIDGELIFGDTIFSANNLDWDGHCWIIFGNLIADVSIFRTAYSESSPLLLRNKILSLFGNGRGLFQMQSEKIQQAGFLYKANYVLTDEEITGLFKGAHLIINS